MICILNNVHTYNAEWCFEELKEIIKPHHRIAIIAFAFREQKIPNAEVWDQFYGCPKGSYYQGFVNTFKDFGIAAEQLEILDYYRDTHESALEKIRKADILYFLGGLPEVMMARLEELGLVEAIKGHKGIVMGYSAGTLIQLGEYHLSPDEDYAEFVYYPGFGFVKDFYVEVHYEGSAVQQESIQRVLRERRKPVYAVGNAGALIVDENGVKTIGDVTLFEVAPDEN